MYPSPIEISKFLKPRNLFRPNKILDYSGLALYAMCSLRTLQCHSMRREQVCAGKQTTEPAPKP